MEDWYSISQEPIFQNGGRRLLEYYNDSPSFALQSVYPKHDWILERFEHKPLHLRKHYELHKQFLDTFKHKYDPNNISKGFWKNIENQRYIL